MPCAASPHARSRAPVTRGGHRSALRHSTLPDACSWEVSSHAPEPWRARHSRNWREICRSGCRRRPNSRFHMQAWSPPELISSYPACVLFARRARESRVTMAFIKITNFLNCCFRARSKTSRHAWVSPPDHSRPSCVDGSAAGFYPAGFHHGGFNDRSVQTRFIALGGSGAGTRDLVADDFISLPQASPDLCRHAEHAGGEN